MDLGVNVSDRQGSERNLGLRREPLGVNIMLHPFTCP